MIPELGTCAACGVVGYLTRKGLRSKHPAKVEGQPRYERITCPGSGQAPGAIVDRQAVAP